MDRSNNPDKRATDAAAQKTQMAAGAAYGKRAIDTRTLVLLALFTAMVVVMQLLGSFIRFGPFSVSLVLMPIAIGAALMGVYAGGWLGLAFGLVVLLSGDATPFFMVSVPATVFVVLIKGALAGLAAGVAYRVFAKKSKTAAAVAAAAVCPIVNTGVFIIGGYAFFLPTLAEWGLAAGAVNVTSFIFLVMVGPNFLFELGLNLVLSPVIVRLVQYGQAMWGKRV
ncbi:MAG: ECF transporter S component [Oscillospiraceae bacterium]|nr:ECF transporter S component [Oscillospiraceae bacterium]